MRRLLAFATLAVLSACTDPEGARQAVEAYGLTDVKTTGFEAFGCSDRDSAHTGFRAVNARGQTVEGVVCGDIGPFGKAATVRIFRVVPNGTSVPLVH